MLCISSEYVLRLFSLSSKPAGQSQGGFTLIELITVVAIIGILSVIAVSSYYKYIAETHRGACLSEAKSYSNQVFYIINDPEDNILPTSPTISACQSITDATGWTLETQQKIIAVAKSPSNARIECDVPNGSPCIVAP